MRFTLSDYLKSRHALRASPPPKGDFRKHIDDIVLKQWLLDYVAHVAERRLERVERNWRIKVVTYDEAETMSNNLDHDTAEALFESEQRMRGALIVRGLRHGEEGSWTAWVRLPATLNDDEAWALAEEYGRVSREGHHRGVEGNPGGPFAYNGHLKRSRSYILITQSGGLDI